MAKRRPTDPAPRPGDAPGDADHDAFERAMAGVRRLPPDAHGDRVLARPNAGDPRIEPPARAAPEADTRSDRDDPAHVAAGVDRRELRKLKRGDYPPGDSLDLHGLKAHEAVARASSFVDHSRARHRCVAIIHGRGLRSAGNVPVLRTRVRAMLREHPAVLAFTDAPAHAGGAGAVFVLLRR